MNDDTIPRGAGRILLVEDDVALGAASARVLSQLGGFDVTHVQNWGEAIRQLKAAAWDLVLTDIEMPGMSGLEFLELVHRLAPMLAVVVITGHPSFDRAVQAMRGSAADFLQKPVPPRELVAKVSQLVKRDRSARSARIGENH